MYVLGRNSISTHEILFDDFQILYGYNTGDRKTYLLNYYILVEKFDIYKQKLDKKPTFTSFLAFLKEKVLVHRAFATASRSLKNVQAKWTTLLSLLND